MKCERTKGENERSRGGGLRGNEGAKGGLKKGSWVGGWVAMIISPRNELG